MTFTGTATPYGDAAWAYRRAGWQGVIPIGYGPRKKNPPFKGYTGWTGLTPSGADVQAWVDGRESRWNVGLHIPPGVIVVDVDAYHGGDRTLARLVEKVGHALPATWTSTARGAGSPSRQFFYRAHTPHGRVWVDHPGGHRSGIDAIHTGHRYSAVWPSLNPDADNAEYGWYDLDGEWYEGPPQLSWLTILDADWVTVLSKEGTPIPGQAADDETTNAAVARFPAGPPCAPVAAAVRRELERIEAATRGVGGLHDPGRIFALVALAIDKGHAGVAAALSIHQEAYVAARVDHRGESPDSAGQEWWRSVRGAVGKLLHASGGAVALVCDCRQPDLPPLPPVEDPAAASSVEDVFVERQRMLKRAQKVIEAEEEAQRTEQRKIRLTPASAFRIKAVKWVWEGRMPLGEITLIPGREGAGKSTFLAWQAAAVTRGQLPGMHFEHPRAVLYAATEDSWEYTIAPRLLAAGADMDLVYRVDVVEVDAGRFGKLSMPVDNRALIDAAHEVKAAVLMCDPIISIIDDKINTFKAQELRSALEPLKRAAEEAELALVGLVHFNKTKDTDVLSMISGSRAWAEVARAVVAIAVDKDAEEYTCVVSQVKNNLGRSDLPHLKYTIRSAVLRAVDHPAADEDVEIGRLHWTGESDRGVEDLLTVKVENTRAGDVTTAVTAFVAERFTLSGQRVSMADISARFPDETPDNLRKVLSRAVNRGALKRPARGQYEPGDEQPRSCPGCQRPMQPGENFCRRCAQSLDAVDPSARRAAEDGW